jgi:hypothetical protein
MIGSKREGSVPAHEVGLTPRRDEFDRGDELPGVPRGVFRTMKQQAEHR